MRNTYAAFKCMFRSRFSCCKDSDMLQVKFFHLIFLEFQGCLWFLFKHPSVMVCIVLESTVQTMCTNTILKEHFCSTSAIPNSCLFCTKHLSHIECTKRVLCTKHLPHLHQTSVSHQLYQTFASTKLNTCLMTALLYQTSVFPLLL